MQYSRPWLVVKKILVSVPSKTAISYFSTLETEYGHRIASYIALKHTFYTPFKPLCLPLHGYLYAKSFSEKQKQTKKSFSDKGTSGQRHMLYVCAPKKILFVLLSYKKKDNRVEQNNNSYKHG